jgi:hypothetical protein
MCVGTVASAIPSSPARRETSGQKQQSTLVTRRLRLDVARQHGMLHPARHVASRTACCMRTERGAGHAWAGDAASASEGLSSVCSMPVARLSTRSSIDACRPSTTAQQTNTPCCVRRAGTRCGVGRRGPTPQRPNIATDGHPGTVPHATPAGHSARAAPRGLCSVARVCAPAADRQQRRPTTPRRADGRGKQTKTREGTEKDEHTKTNKQTNYQTNKRVSEAAAPDLLRIRRELFRRHAHDVVSREQPLDQRPRGVAAAEAHEQTSGSPPRRARPSHIRTGTGLGCAKP